MGESINKVNSVIDVCTVEIKIDLTASDVNIKKGLIKSIVMEIDLI